MVSDKAQAPQGPKETREAILDAAEVLLARNGYRRMTIDEVAKQAELGKGTIYLYFRSKDELALSVIDRLNSRLRERMKAILRGHGTPVERLRNLLLERVMYRFDSVQAQATCLDQILAHLRAELLERRHMYHEQEAVILVEAIVEGRTLGYFLCDDPHATAHAMLTATAALLPYSLSKTELGERNTVKERCLRLADLLIAGIRNSRHPDLAASPG